MIFGNLFGLWALLFLAPFILLYLIRPRTIEKTIPSLMFIIREQKHMKEASFLRNLLRNLLFLIQLIALAGMIFTIAEPIINVPYSVAIRNAVIVLDASGSMQAKDGFSTRFDNAIMKARDNLGGETSIVLAENSPIILLEQGSRMEASELLRKIAPKATASNIGDAMLVAGDVLGKKRGRIIVISDFMQTEGADILVAKRTLESKGNLVEFIDVGSKGNNVGIVDLELDKEKTVVGIKNFKESDENIKINVINNGNKINSKSVKITAESKEKFEFETLQGITKVEIDAKDDLELDNSVYISVPSREKVKILLITNNEENNYIKAALSASRNTELEIRNPPTVNAYNIKHDIVIINKITKSLFVPADYVDLKKYVQNGGILIVTSQDELRELDKLLEIIPVTLGEKKEEQATACVDVIGRIFPADPYGEEPCFISLKRYFKAQPHNGSSILMSANEEPLVSYKAVGNGKVIYYGIFDEYSDFYSNSFYPVFWRNMVDFFLQIDDIKDYNFAAGKLLVIEKQDVKTPSAVINTNKLTLDEAGIYELGNKKIAVNMLDEQESDISKENDKIKGEIEEIESEKEKKTEEFKLDIPLLAFVLLLLGFEVFYIKFRGDL